MSKITNIFQLLDKVNNQGIVTLTFSKEQLNWFKQIREVNNRPKIKSPTETSAFIMDNIMGQWGIFNLPLQVNKNILKQIDLKTNENETDYLVSFDLFKYLNINKNNIQEQVIEIRNFFELSKKLMIQIRVKHNEFEFGGTVKILNNKVKGKTTYEILLQPHDGDDVPELNQQLVDMAENSDTLKNLLTETSLNLNKIGVYALSTIDLKELGVINVSKYLERNK